jgi:hypothetical protein
MHLAGESDEKKGWGFPHQVKTYILFSNYPVAHVRRYIPDTSEDRADRQMNGRTNGQVQKQLERQMEKGLEQGFP